MTPAEQMRQWINFVQDAQHPKITHIEFNGLGKVIAGLTTMAIILGGLGDFVHGLDAGYDLLHKICWLH